MSIGLAITMLIDAYEIAKNNQAIRKPISWALYATWQMVDKKEKPRKAPKEQKEIADSLIEFCEKTISEYEEQKI